VCMGECGCRLPSPRSVCLTRLLCACACDPSRCASVCVCVCVCLCVRVCVVPRALATIASRGCCAHAPALSVLWCVAVCSGALLNGQSSYDVAVYCSVLCNLLHCVALCCFVLCGALHCVAVCCNVLRCGAGFFSMDRALMVLQGIQSLLRCVAVCCSVLRCAVRLL